MLVVFLDGEFANDSELCLLKLLLETASFKSFGLKLFALGSSSECWFMGVVEAAKFLNSLRVLVCLSGVKLLRYFEKEFSVFFFGNGAPPFNPIPTMWLPEELCARLFFPPNTQL